jgi:hypothetical protein
VHAGRATSSDCRAGRETHRSGEAGCPGGGIASGCRAGSVPGSGCLTGGLASGRRFAVTVAGSGS